MPLWVWNDELQWGRLKEQVTQFKKLGFGGVFVHPRPGLITEYLGLEWFEMWKRSMLHCKKLGMQCNIYDENSYPSGFAGGYAPSVSPDTACQFVAMSFIPPNQPASVAVLSVFRFKKRNGRIVSVTDVSHLPPERRAGGAPLMVFELRRASASPWTGDFPYTDLTNPETVKAFIATTHERYRQHFGKEFGKTIAASFADEPLIAADLVYAAGTRPALPLSSMTLAEFQRRYRYSLIPHLPSLFADIGDYRRVRFDYWQIIHDLWKENFMQPLGDWCEGHRLVLTGHYMEHEWPAPFITPDDMSLYACMQMPGIDLLLTTLLKPERRYQGFGPINDDMQMLFTMRMLLSAVNQLGKPRALSEMWGAGGWDSTIEDYKRMGDWALAHGINFFNPHLSYVTTRGARKRDHPQSFSDHSPWWSEIKGLNDRIARLSYILSQGKMKNRVLLLQPTTGAFLVTRPDDKASAEFERMKKEHGSLVQLLCDNQIDFDLGDEYLLEEYGHATKGQLTVGKAKYDLVIIPPAMTNMRHQTVSLLEKYVRYGGEVLTLSSPAKWVDGRPSNLVSMLQRRFQSRWLSVKNPKTFLKLIQRRLNPYVEFSSPRPRNFSHHMRHLDDGSTIHFFFNGSARAFHSEVTLQGKSLEVWDADTGDSRAAEFMKKGQNHVATSLHLPPTQSILLRAVPTDSGYPPVRFFSRNKRERSLRVAPMKVTADSLNVLVLDYCDVKYLGKGERGINTWRGNWNIWQAHGFERPAWDNSVQFRKRILDRNHFGPETGFEATFRFNIARSTELRSLELAIECPELYHVYVNGKKVDYRESERWVDPHLRSVSIARVAHPGENEVRIIGRPFDVRMELENIYVRGKFALEPAKSGFKIGKEHPLRLGPWTQQGLPFYSELVHYDTNINVPPTDKRIIVQLPSWKGGSATVQVDGKRVGSIAWLPYELDITNFISSGEHTLRVTVAGTPKNLFGPFHDPARSRNSAWPVMWSRFPEKGPPPGKKYDLEKYGLFKPVRVLLREM